MEIATALAQKGYCTSHPYRVWLIVNVQLSVHSWKRVGDLDEARLLAEALTADKLRGLVDINLATRLFSSSLLIRIRVQCIGKLAVVDRK